MPEKIFGIRDIVPNNIRDNVPNTKNSYFQMSSTMSLIPKKNVPKTAGIRDIVPNTDTLYILVGKISQRIENISSNKIS